MQLHGLASETAGPPHPRCAAPPRPLARRIRAEVPQKRQPYIVALTADALEGRRELSTS